MQRGAIREEQEQLRSEHQRAIDDEHWVLDVPLSTQSKYVPCLSCSKLTLVQ